MGHTGYLFGILLTILLVSPVVKGQFADPVAEKPFLISMYPGATEEQNQLVTLVYQELFARLGISVDLRPFPMKRASVQADEGKIDGEAVRIASYSELHPDLRMVNFPVVQVTFVTYARRGEGLRLNDGWDSLYSSGYTIGYLRGIVYSEQKLRDHINPARLNESKTVEQGLLKVIYDRTDLFVYRLNTRITHPEIVDNIVVASVLQEIPLYLHLHKKHEKMIPKFEKILRDMSAEGRLTEICTRVYQEEAQKHCLQTGGSYSPILW